MKQLTIALSILLLLISSTAAEDITIKTFYPSPFGVYSRLRLVPQAALSGACNDGSLYVESTSGRMNICQGGVWNLLSGAWEVEGNNIFIDDPNMKVGIGTSTPASILDIRNSSDPKIILKDTTGSTLTIASTDTNSSISTGATPLRVVNNSINTASFLPSGGVSLNHIEGGLTVGSAAAADGEITLRGPSSAPINYTFSIDSTTGELLLHSNVQANPILKINAVGDLFISGNIEMQRDGVTQNKLKVKKIDLGNISTTGYYATYAPD